jgi:hypothetical protein
LEGVETFAPVATGTFRGGVGVDQGLVWLVDDVTAVPPSAAVEVEYDLVPSGPSGRSEDDGRESFDATLSAEIDLTQ